MGLEIETVFPQGQKCGKSNLLWNLYLQSSAATMSISRIYLDFLSKPDTRTL